MSFNLLKFKKLKKNEIINQIIEIDYLIVGFDAKTMLDIFVSDKTFNDSFLFLDQNERTIPENLSLIDQLPYPWINNQELNSHIKFYKDGEFRSFQGRHKVNNCHGFLLKYVKNLQDFSWMNWFEGKLSESQKEKFNQSLVFGQVKSILRAHDMWEIHTFDLKIIKAKKIKWNLSPEVFLKLFHYESQYPKNFLNWCSSFKPLNMMFLQFKISAEIFQKIENALIPLTMGTDEGYFLVTTKPKSDGFYNLNLLFIFDQTELQEEDVANKIRLMKKQLLKIWGLNEKLLKDERVLFLPSFTFIKDHVLEEVKGFIQDDPIFAFDQQYFLQNENMPVESSFQYISNLQSQKGEIDFQNESSL